MKCQRTFNGINLCNARRTKTNLKTTTFRFNEIVTDKALVTNQVDRNEAAKRSERKRSHKQTENEEDKKKKLTPKRRTRKPLSGSLVISFHTMFGVCVWLSSLVPRTSSATTSLMFG